LVVTNQNGSVLRSSPSARSLIEQATIAPPRAIANWFPVSERNKVRSAIGTLTSSQARSTDLGRLTLGSSPEKIISDVQVSATVVLRLNERECRLLWRLTAPSEQADVGAAFGALPAVALRLATSRSVDEVLAATVDGVRTCVPSVVFADVYLRDRHAADRRQFGDTPAQHLNQLQRGLREGPAVDALAGREIWSTDLPNDLRWPRLATVIPTFLRAGMAIPLHGAHGPMAALVLVSGRAHAFDATVQRAARLFALHAGLALDRAITEEALRRAVDIRSAVGTATGVLAERYRIDADVAYAALRRASQDSNVKIIELAEEIVNTRQIPRLIDDLIRNRPTTSG